MRNETFKQAVKVVKQNAWTRGVARTLDMRAAYSARSVDTSLRAAMRAIQRDGVLVRRDIEKVAISSGQLSKRRSK